MERIKRLPCGRQVFTTCASGHCVKTGSYVQALGGICDGCSQLNEFDCTQCKDNPCIYNTQDTELPGMWSRSDFMDGLDTRRGSCPHSPDNTGTIETTTHSETGEAISGHCNHDCSPEAKAACDTPYKGAWENCEPVPEPIEPKPTCPADKNCTKCNNYQLCGFLGYL